MRALSRVGTWLLAALLAASSYAPAYAGPTLAAEADRLLARWAPVYVQHVAPDDNGADRPTRIDFDGDWDATNNWDNQARFGTQLPPAAYGAAILTDTHAYLTYTLFYPRDWSDAIRISLICHDNDLETVMLVVARGQGAAADGELVEVRAKAHFSITDTAADRIARTEDGRVLMSVESHGHGIAACRPGARACEARRGRIVYAPGERASAPPERAEGQLVRYELLPLYGTLWARRDSAHDQLWDLAGKGAMRYTGRRHGRAGAPLGSAMATSRFAGGVTPPWALAGGFGARGDWFLDPAGVGDDTAVYAHHPFLDDLLAECTGEACADPPPPARKLRDHVASYGLTGLVLSLGLVLVRGRPRRRGAALRFWPRKRSP
jgi:hypothetical protein